MHRPSSPRGRILALSLVAIVPIVAPACRRKTEAPIPRADSTLSDTSGRLPTFPDVRLSSVTPDPHGLVASIMAKAATPVPKETLDWLVVPTPAPAGRILWAQDFEHGYQDAVSLNKGMVVLFGTPGQPWYEKVLASIESPEIGALADQAIWIRSDPTKEIMAKNVCTALGVEHLPTISVLDPDPEIISEEQRIEGYEEPERLARDLKIPLLRANGKMPKVPTRKP